MHSESFAERQAAKETMETARFDWSILWPWALGFGLTVYLGLNGGGFDPLVSDQVGIAAWWVVLFAFGVAALPRLRLAPLAWVGFGLLAAFVIWTGLSLSWTESTEKTAADLARVATYLGIFALGLGSRDSRTSPRMLSAVAAGIVVVALVGLLSRLHPDWFPEAEQTAQFLTSGEERLSYPLNYWNGLAALIAIGLPLLAQLAAKARQIAVRALAAAVMPAMILAIYFTLSRGGIAAAAVVLAVYLALAHDRIPKALTLGLTGAGGAFLILLAHRRPDLVHGHMNAAAHSQGDEMIFIVIAVGVVVGLAQAGIALAGQRTERPGWARVAPRQAAIATAAVAVAVVIGLLAVNAPHRVSNAWSDFRRQEVGAVEGTERLSSFAGESRYQFWSSAVREFKHDPLTGTGSGTFQIWWTRDGDIAETVIDTHSLYLQTAGELGLIGVGLLVGLLVLNLLAGGRAAIRARGDRRSLLAAIFAGTLAFWLTSIFDWIWKLPVIPVVTLLLLAVLLTVDTEPEGRRDLRSPLWLRLGAVAAALVAIVAIAIPLTSTDFLRKSQAQARDGDTAAALDDAHTAQNAMPGAAGPRLQEALLLETESEFPAAAQAATEATDREPNEWRNWLVLSRIEAEQGNADAAIRAYEEARSLNPRNPIFHR
jgi:O-Antigen ligase